MERFQNFRSFSGDPALPERIADVDEAYPDGNIMTKIEGDQLGEYGLVIGDDDVPVFDDPAIQNFGELYLHEMYVALDPWQLNAIQWVFVKPAMSYEDHPFVTETDYDDPVEAVLRQFESLLLAQAGEETLVLSEHGDDGGFFERADEQHSTGQTVGFET